MPLTAAERETIAAFRAQVEQELADDPRFGTPEVRDREDESTLATRFAVAPRLWMEVALRPFLPHVRVGLLTDDRWLSEDLETAIEESGDTMSEFVESGLVEVGIEWPAPPVEHYRDQGKFFYFATPLELRELADLSKPAALSRTVGLVRGYCTAFASAIKRARG